MNISKNYRILFSFWVFCWAVAYCLARELFPYEKTFDLWNPAVALLVALSYQFYVLIHILFRAKRPLLPIILAKYTIITICIKLVPLYIVLQHRVNWTNSIISFALAFLVYCVYITQQNLNIFEIYHDMTEAFVHNTVSIPFQELLDFLLP